jgi:hypothetical protein
MWHVEQDRHFPEDRAGLIDMGDLRPLADDLDLALDEDKDLAQRSPSAISIWPDLKRRCSNPLQ